MKRIGLIGVALIMVCATSAMTAASAAARPYEFKAETYPARWAGTNTNIHRFEIAGLPILCESARFEGEETNESTALTVHPTYSECHTSVAGLGNSTATVDTTGCNYLLFAAQPEQKGGSLEIACSAGRAIEVTSAVLPTCRIKVGTQILKGIEYVDQAAPPKRVTVNVEVQTMKWTTESCGIATSGGSDAKYSGSALFSGFKAGTTEADGIEVS